MSRTFFVCIILFSFLMVKAQKGLDNSAHKVLCINSYNISYSWADSLTKGIIETFNVRPEISIYMEYLDSKRFGTRYFESYYELFKEKYKNFDFDIVIVSDNNALDFLLTYKDSLVPNTRILVCGVNNPNDYPLYEENIYCIKEGVDQDSVNRLILRIMPEVQKLYFIADSTRTSQINLNYAKSLEANYKVLVDFEYVTNISIDSLYKFVGTLQKSSAIAMLNVFSNIDGAPINSDQVLIESAQHSSVPIFMDSEVTFGKGIIGGIFNSPAMLGREIASLAIKFLDNPQYEPAERIISLRDRYYFDYEVVKKYNINPKLLPLDSKIINKPVNFFYKYFKFILIIILIVLGLLAIISVLLANINKRKRAESTVIQKLEEIQQQNIKLEEAYEKLNENNDELENINKKLNVAKEKSEESDRLKTAFLENMSHEIRTPLNVIVGFASLFNDDNVAKKDKKRYAKLIESNSNHLLKLIEDILDISKSETGQLQLNFSNVLLKDLLFNINESFLSYFNKSDVEFKIVLDNLKDGLVLYTDTLRLRQILNNLISNAYKFTEKGIVEAGCNFKNKGEIEFYVRDTGIGIDPEIKDKIFERFWKIEKLGKGFNPGTGLGLSISKRLSELLGGEMWVESVPGKGSTFYFTHPLKSYEQSEILNKKSNNLTNDIENLEEILMGLRIVIVDDNLHNLELLKSILKKYNTNIIEFTDGSQVVNYFSNSKYADLMLLDIKMPETDGVTAFKIVKEKNPDLPIIAQTAYALKNEVDDILKVGFDDYIAKPINPGELLSKIKKVLKKKR